MLELSQIDKKSQKRKRKKKTNDDNKNNNKPKEIHKYILKEMFKGILEGGKSLISDSYFFFNFQFFAYKCEKTVEREFYVV